MVKNIVSALCLVVVGIFAAVISINTPLYAATQNSSNLFGQAQSYDVLLRGDGGAIVNAKFQVSNNDESVKTKYSYSLANGELKTVTAYQEITCSSLPTIISQNGQATTASGISSTTIQGYETDTDTPECYPGYNKNTTTDSTSAKTSTRYYAPTHNNIYKKIDTKINGNSFDLTLPNAVKSGKSANIIMVYNAANISNGTLGIHKFTFTTLKTSEQIVSANIAISVDEGYYLADSSKVKNNYLQKNSSSLNNALQSGTTATNSTLDSSAQNYINSIGNNGMITKTANQVLPGETFSVSGKFATSTFLLNWPRYLLICIAAVAIIGLLLFWYIIRRKRMLKQDSDQATQDKNITSDSTSIDSVDVDEKSQETQDEAETYNEPANAYSNQDAASANVRSIPFYGLYHSVKQKYRERKIRPMFFAWLCALYLIIFGAVLTGIGFLYSNSFNSSVYGYDLSTSQTILQVSISFSLAVAGVLGFLLICFGLPFLYAKSAKGAFKIIVHIALVFIVLAIMTTVISVVMPDNKDSDNYGLPKCNPGSICIQ